MPKLKKKSIEQRSRADKERKQQIRGKSLHVVTLLYVYYLVWYTDLGGRGVFRRLTSLLFILRRPPEWLIFEPWMSFIYILYSHSLLKIFVNSLICPQTERNFRFISTEHGFNAKVLNWYLININLKVFAIWVMVNPGHIWQTSTCVLCWFKLQH